MRLDKKTKQQLLDLYESKKICMEGNILKILDSDGDKEFQEYIEESIKRDKESRRKRLEVTKKVQAQNVELTKKQKENDDINKQLTDALKEAEVSNRDAIKSRDEAENAKEIAENDLEIIQKKSQFELIGKIVRAALWVILGVGVVTTGIYVLALTTGLDTSVIGSTWSNIIGILLTNAFSIIGTIMGVKYASEKNRN